MIAVAESAAGSSSVCSTGGTNQEGSAGSGDGSRNRRCRSEQRDLLPAPIGARGGPLDQSHEDPGNGHHGRDRTGIELRDRRGDRNCGEEQHLEQQARHRRTAPDGCSERADPGVGRGYRRTGVLVDSSRVPRREDLALRDGGHPPAGFRSGRSARARQPSARRPVRVPARAPCARSRSRRRALRRPSRRSPRAPSRAPVRVVPRASRRRSRAPCGASSASGWLPLLVESLPQFLRRIGDICGRFRSALRRLPPPREPPPESGDADDAGEPGECALHAGDGIAPGGAFVSYRRRASCLSSPGPFPARACR